MHNIYEKYYIDQAGGGINSVYRGSSGQRGHGFGSFFTGLYKFFSPIFKSGAKTLTREVLNTGLNVLTDLDEGRSLKESARTRLTETGGNIRNKLLKFTGGGRKAQYASRVSIDKTKRRTKKQTKKKIRKVFRDIFSSKK